MPDQGGEATEAHRRGQARIAASAAGEVLAGWSQVSPTSLEESSARWLQDSMDAARRHRRRSRRLSADYLRLLRAFRTGVTVPPLEGSGGTETTIGDLRDALADSSSTPRRAHDDDRVRIDIDADFEWPEGDEESEDRRAMVSLIVTGPVAAARGIQALRRPDEGRGRLDDADFLADLDAVMRNAGALAAGAADRDAQMGGRDLVDAYARADRSVVGWARVTDVDPCHFCALLASRGAVYRSVWTARYQGRTGRRARPIEMPHGWEDWSPEHLAEWEERQGLQRFHDNCHCTIMPVYSREDWLPEDSRAFRELYFESTRGLAGQEARQAFRRAIEARRRRAHARGVSVR